MRRLKKQERNWLQRGAMEIHKPIGFGFGSVACRLMVPTHP